MHSFVTASLIATAFAASALAQSSPGLDGIFHHTVPENINCGPDILVDDFHVFNRSMLPIRGEVAPRQVNLLGGDYGGNDNVTLSFAVNVANKNIEVTPLSDKGFFFFKFDAGACYDISGLNALAFDVIAPVGGSFDIGLTQKTANCTERLAGESGRSDSKYVPLTKYATPDGKTKQTVVVPFYDLAGTTAVGTPFDFVHLKDVTFINWKPANAKFQISDIRLRRVCGDNGPTGANQTVSTGSMASLPGSVVPPAGHASTTNGGAAPAPTGSSGSAGAAGSSNSSSSASSLQVYGAGLLTMVLGSLIAL